MMRTATFGRANSLDNFLARPDGSGDWLKWGKEAAQVMQHLPRVSFRSRAWSSSARCGSADRSRRPWR